MDTKKLEEKTKGELEEAFDPHFSSDFIKQVEKESEEALEWFYNRKHKSREDNL